MVTEKTDRVTVARRRGELGACPPAWRSTATASRVAMSTSVSSMP